MTKYVVDSGTTFYDVQMNVITGINVTAGVEYIQATKPIFYALGVRPATPGQMMLLYPRSLGKIPAGNGEVWVYATDPATEIFLSTAAETVVATATTNSCCCDASGSQAEMKALETELQHAIDGVNTRFNGDIHSVNGTLTQLELRVNNFLTGTGVATGTAGGVTLIPDRRAQRTAHPETDPQMNFYPVESVFPYKPQLIFQGWNPASVPKAEVDAWLSTVVARIKTLHKFNDGLYEYGANLMGDLYYHILSRFQGFNLIAFYKWCESIGLETPRTFDYINYKGLRSKIWYECDYFFILFGYYAYFGYYPNVTVNVEHITIPNKGNFVNLDNFIAEYIPLSAKHSQHEIIGTTLAEIYDLSKMFDKNPNTTVVESDVTAIKRCIQDLIVTIDGYGSGVIPAGGKFSYVGTQTNGIDGKYNSTLSFDVATSCHTNVDDVFTFDIGDDAKVLKNIIHLIELQYPNITLDEILIASKILWLPPVFIVIVVLNYMETHNPLDNMRDIIDWIRLEDVKTSKSDFYPGTGLSTPNGEAWARLVWHDFKRRLELVKALQPSAILIP